MWLDLVDAVALSGPSVDVARYVVTEMVNNAVDHSGARTVTVSVRRVHGGSTTIDISDNGDGLFHHLATGLGLEDDLAALGELTKGKQTTDPERHSGEGIFFSSKAVDTFTAEANGCRLIFDNLRDDFAVGTSKVVIGTTISVVIDPASTRTMLELFNRYTDDLRFSRSRPRIKLYELGVSFVSRSEAKRVARGLDEFSEVEVDFANVDDVGQGFADELFRVWANAHPTVALVPIGMNPAITFMVARAVRAAAARDPRSPR
ncbi:MAG: MerR family DNA-binding transcriptional regulator [Ilumatobacteraceae bacterium]|nr:MerR family DNA-binding transcriptional regulator [Ilumatobacteraceae bacterium]